MSGIRHYEQIKMIPPPTEPDHVQRIEGPPGIVRMYMPRTAGDEYLVIKFDRPVDANNARIQFIRFGRRTNQRNESDGRDKHKAREFRPVTVNAVGWPVILIPEGATEITIEKSAIDQMYRPPYVRSNKQRQWVDWSATQSGIRHNSGTERRNGTIELLFRVVYWQKGSFVAGKTSDEKLVITQFYVTKTAGPVFKRRYDLLRA